MTGDVQNFLSAAIVVLIGSAIYAFLLGLVELMVSPARARK